VDVIAAVYQNVTPVCLVADQSEIDLGRWLLARAGLPQSAVRFIRLPMDTAWVRDYGPLFVRRADGSVVVVDLDYKAWAIRADRTRDDDVPKVLGEWMGLRVVDVPLKISGGNILSNGDGVCVTTTAAAVSMRKAFYAGQAAVVGSEEAQAVMRVLGEHLGFHTWVCLNALKGEPTGDVDMFAAFVAPDVVLVGRLDPALEPVNAAILDDAAAKLTGVETSRGAMKVHRIPMPAPRRAKWRSYTNVIFANGVILMPKFSDEDPALREEALALYARLLPGWKVIGIKADGLEQAGGLLHCLTRNVPWFVGDLKSPDRKGNPATGPAARAPEAP